MFLAKRTKLLKKWVQKGILEGGSGSETLRNQYFPDLEDATFHAYVRPNLLEQNFPVGAKISCLEGLGQ
jgi:hypothetical protein